MNKTKTRILTEAERLFAKNGFSTTSIRHIIKSANANLSAIHYHFGSKENLFLEIVRTHLESVNKKRMQLLEDSLRKEKDELPTAKKIVSAFMIPIIEMHESNSQSRSFSMMLGRAFSENPQLKRKVYLNFFKDISAHFIKAFHVALPWLSEEEIYWRFHFMICTMVGALMSPDRLRFLSNDRCRSESMNETIHRLIDFVVLGMENDCSRDHND
jgi:AcrR family transcriptional regulator